MQFKYQKGVRLYESVATTLESEIIRGEYKKEEKLPSIMDLSLHYVVNPNTMSRAMQEAKKRGLLKGNGKEGYFVIDDEFIIEKRKKILAEAITKEFIVDMQRLGIGKDQIMDLIVDL